MVEDKAIIIISQFVLNRLVYEGEVTQVLCLCSNVVLHV